jgi:hypothetical protein
MHMLTQTHRTVTEECFSEMETEVGTYHVHCTYRFSVDNQGVQYETTRNTEITTPIHRAHRIHLTSTFPPAIINAIHDDVDKKIAKQIKGTRDNGEMFARGFTSLGTITYPDGRVEYMY